MSRQIFQERRVRGIAAVHALVGSVIIACSILMVIHGLQNSSSRSQTGLAEVLLGIAGAIGGVIVVAVAWLLWRYNPFARWVTGALFAFASAMVVYQIVVYEAEAFTEARALWMQEVHSRVFELGRVVVIQTMVVAWSSAVLLTLFRPDSRVIFSAGYRKSIKTDRNVRIRFYSSPYFVTGLFGWLVIAVVIGLVIGLGLRI